MSAALVLCGRAVPGAAAPEREPSLCLAWQSDARAECPSVADLEAAVRDTLGRPLVTSRACDLHVKTQFHAAANGVWSADLTFASPAGEVLGRRSLEIRDAPCSALAEPMALVIALMAEGKSSEGTALRVSAPMASPSEQGPRSMTTMSVAGALSSGLTGEVGWGMTAGVGSRVLAGVPLRLDTTFWFPTEAGAPAPAGRFWAWLGGAGVCPSLLQGRRLALAVCARVVAGLVRGVGRGLDEIQSATRPLGAASLAGQVSLRVSRRASIYLSVGAAVPWVRARFVYRDPGDAAVLVHQPETVIPVAELGVDLGLGGSRAGGDR